MTKIPVGKTIAYAYGFTFGNFLTVLGLSWVPLTMMAVVGYFTIPAYFAGMQAMFATGDASSFSGASGLMFLFYAVMLVGFVMIYVALARQALGLRSGPAFLYFSLDAAFWRLLGAYLLTFLILVGGMILAAIASGILIAIIGALASVAFLIVVLGMIYLLLRLFFLQAPLAVTEGRKILSRSWSLSRGNFWRIFGILAAIVIPFVVVQLVVQMTLFSSLAFSPLTRGASPAEVAEYMTQVINEFSGLFPVLLVIGIVFNAAFISMLTSASAFAYRALVPAPEGTATEFA